MALCKWTETDSGAHGPNPLPWPLKCMWFFLPFIIIFEHTFVNPNYVIWYPSQWNPGLFKPRFEMLEGGGRRQLNAHGQGFDVVTCELYNYVNGRLCPQKRASRAHLNFKQDGVSLFLFMRTTMASPFRCSTFLFLKWKDPHTQQMMLIDCSS